MVVMVKFTKNSNNNTEKSFSCTLSPKAYNVIETLPSYSKLSIMPQAI